jgi:hypothetical protein
LEFQSGINETFALQMEDTRRGKGQGKEKEREKEELAALRRKHIWLSSSPYFILI